MDYESRAQEIVVRFLDTIPDLRHTLAEDVQAAYDGDPAAKSLVEIVFCYPGVAAITVYRMAHELHRLGVPLLPRMMTEYATGRRASTSTLGRRSDAGSSSTMARAS